MPTKMRLLPDYIKAIRDGRKTTTIRVGKRGVINSELIFESNVDSLKVTIVSVYYRKFIDFTETDAHKDGFTSIEELTTALTCLYPNTNPHTVFTIIEFSI